MSRPASRSILSLLIVSCFLALPFPTVLASTTASPPDSAPRVILALNPHTPGTEDTVSSQAQQARMLVASAALDLRSPAPFGGYDPRGKPSPHRTLVLTGLALIPFDHPIVEAFPRIRSGEHCDGLTSAVSSLGDAKTILPAVAGHYVLGTRADKKASLTVLSAVANAAVLTQSLKMAVGRKRPGESGDELRVDGPGHNAYNSSFPSGHTSFAFAVATVMADHEPKRKWLYYGLAIAVGISRIRKGAHFPSDVLVGAGTGMYAARSAIESGGRPLHFRF